MRRRLSTITQADGDCKIAALLEQSSALRERGVLTHATRAQ